MTPERFAQLRQINSEVNAIPYQGVTGLTEPQDFWADSPVEGQSWVCRDYVLDKAKRLTEAGFDKAALTIILCWTEIRPENNNQREYHAVLAVEDDPDTWILDSRFPDVRKYQEPDPQGYVWDKRQVAGTIEFAPVA
jgi:predicted transglutaminase-like cysteine proteinase